MANLALKYRPKDFESVIGQDNIVEILQNQLATGNIKHSYLFVGPAGDGKTTTARILADKLNEGIGNCIEIDAASNNGVENIRLVIENVKFKPMETKYKVYLMDEVHMFSIGAWNALLKTLEETPEHAIFILCTTDPQKIPATILSRCQRFDFKKVGTEEIAKRLRFIVDCENAGRDSFEIKFDQDYANNFKAGQIVPCVRTKNGIFVDDVVLFNAKDLFEHCQVLGDLQVDNEVCEYIAKLANGGVRDAISMLDTCLGYKNELTLKDIEMILGTSNYEIMFKLLEALGAGSEKDIIKIIEDLFGEGRDLKQFINQFIEFVIEVKKYQVMKNFEYTKISKLYEQNLKVIGDYNMLAVYETMAILASTIKYASNVKPIIEAEMMLCVK